MADIFAVDLCTLTWGNDHTATLKFEPISEFPRHFDGESRLFNVDHFFPRARNKKHLVHPISAAAAAIHNVTINVDKKFSQFERPRMSPICRSACRDGGQTRGGTRSHAMKGTRRPRRVYRRSLATALRASSREEPAPSPRTPKNTMTSITATITVLICNVVCTPKILPAISAA